MTRLDELEDLHRRLGEAIVIERTQLYGLAKLRDEVEELLEDLPAPIASILHLTAEVFGVTELDMVGDARDSRTSRARQVAAWLLHDQGMHFKKIGELFGGRHRTTIMAGVRRVAADPEAGAIADRIRRELRTDLPLRAVAS